MGRTTKITREQSVKIISGIVTEVLFDVIQAMQVSYQVEPENSSFAQLVLLDVGQVITEVQQVWQTWQEARIIDRSPNRVPVIKQPEQLQQKHRLHFTKFS
jgi:chemotaxis family two-component system response regulator PixG